MAAVLWLTRLAFATFYVLLGVLLVKTNTDSCGSVFETQVGHALVDHVVSTVVVVDEFECQLKCMGNSSCKSFNVHPGADNTKRVCELNNKTRQMKPGDFQKKKGSTYYGSVKVSCVDLSHDQTEQTNGGHCHPEYEGKQCQTPKPGLHFHHPAHSCKEIQDSGGSQLRGDGEYWIDPGKSGNLLKVYCDMTTDRGGWLLISNLVLQSSNPPSQLPVKSSYRGISSDQMLLTKTAVNELQTHLPFTQMRFHCNKQQGRTFHVTTAANSTGEAVVQYFSGRTDVQPASCGSYVRMENDNSKLGRVCEKWGLESGVYEVGKWGHGQDEDRLYVNPAFAKAAYHWFLAPGTVYCDDWHQGHHVGTTTGDFWKVYVR